MKVPLLFKVSVPCVGCVRIDAVRVVAVGIGVVGQHAVGRGGRQHRVLVDRVRIGDCRGRIGDCRTVSVTVIGLDVTVPSLTV